MRLPRPLWPVTGSIVALALGMLALVATAQEKITVPNFGALDGVGMVAQSSDVILIGRVLETPPYPRLSTLPDDRPPHPAVVSVERVIKGAAIPDRVKVTEGPSPGLFLGPDAIGKSYIFFLHGKAPTYNFKSGPWRFLAATSPYSAGPTIKSQIENSLAASVATRQHLGLGELSRITSFLEGSRTNSPVLTNTFGILIHSTDPQIRGEAIAALVARQVVSAYPVAASYLADRPLGPAWGDILNALAAAPTPAGIRVLSDAAEGSLDPDVRLAALDHLGETRSNLALPSLDAALRASSTKDRLGAVLGLGKIGLPMAIPSIARALDDPDERVRLTAVEALGTIRYHIGSYNLDDSDFRTHEAAYLRTWRGWAQAHSPLSSGR